jgi:hypothetical protein
MTVRMADGGRIVLEGDCGAEDAETLVRLLQETQGSTVEWTSCRRLHTAVFQVLMATGLRIAGPCGDSWIEKCVTEGIDRPGASPGAKM